MEVRLNFNLFKSNICKRLLATSLANAMIKQRVGMFIFELGIELREKMLVRPWVQSLVLPRTKERGKVFFILRI